MGFLICRVCLLQLLLLLLLAFTSSPASAQPAAPPGSARALDAALQEYAFRALAARPRTGIIYNATIPSSLAGVAASALRLRSGSLRRKGVAGGYFNFAVPPGVATRPRVERVVLVYHDLGNLSDRYYPLPAGYAYVAPVVGLLAYDAANLSAAAAAAGGLPELGLVAASGRPISVAFNGGGGGGAAARCVVFGLDGVPRFRDLEEGGNNVCATYEQGHVSIVVNSSGGSAPGPPPPPPPAGAIAPPIPTEEGGEKKGGSGSAAWKVAVAVGVVAGAAALGLVGALMLCLVRYRRDKKLEAMERNAEAGEALRVARVGRAQARAPVASGTRTQPVIENEYAAS
ncbi:uncharacterized protein [Zea mays]|uniref:Uncharacterized protein n=1 Tax=Zea mays TaxID=4577 RepID=A0A1D6IRU3_MAIZE|nr:uncharacterized protein LOC103640699 [Zea mays]AQK38947.1 hypothetical protein ZEAMMB73_Zm00001d023312 [Zea mays]|eukprot:XP_020401226.1 uncharacterized protein LOC103640699 [Zea mays]